MPIVAQYCMNDGLHYFRKPMVLSPLRSRNEVDLEPFACEDGATHTNLILETSMASNYMHV